MADNILINGEPNDKLSVLDRGFQYGDGLFETIAVYQNKPLCWNEHIERLIYGCERLNIVAPDKDLLQQETASLIKSTEQGVIKIIITRGQGGRGYALPEKPAPTRIIALYPWPDHPVTNKEQGINLRLCHLHYSHNSFFSGIKHLNRLEQVMARSEWDDTDIHEGLVKDINDNIVEGTMSNIFCVINGELLTPDLDQCGVEGVIRKQILKLCVSLDIKVKITKLTLDDLYQANELFITNSIIGVWPVKRFEQQGYKPGAVTTRIMNALTEQGIIAP